MHPLLVRAIRDAKDLAWDTGSLRHGRDLEMQQWLPADTVRELQWAKARALVQHAYRNVPFYRRRLGEAGIEPGDIRTPDDYSALPIVSRDDVREHLAEMVATDVRPARLQAVATGGSTGEPLTVYRSRLDTASRAAARRFFGWLGITPEHRGALILGRRGNDRNELLAKRTAFRRFLVNRVALSAFDMNSDTMRAFARFLVSFRPAYMYGYPAAIEEFCRFLAEDGEHRPRIPWVVLTAERSEPSRRSMIEDALGATTIDQYGSNEVPYCAAECPRREGLHVLSDIVLLETVDIAGRTAEAGEPGRVLVTDLVNRACPLLRYELGDFATLSKRECGCGRGLPLMAPIVGRVTDMLVLPGGREVHGQTVLHAFQRFTSEVRRFQAHQLDTGELVVRVVPTSGSDPARLARAVTKELEMRLGLEVPVGVRIVDSIPLEDSGKHRVVKSDVPRGGRSAP